MRTRGARPAWIATLALLTVAIAAPGPALAQRGHFSGGVRAGGGHVFAGHRASAGPRAFAGRARVPHRGFAPRRGFTPRDFAPRGFNGHARVYRGGVTPRALTGHGRFSNAARGAVARRYHWHGGYWRGHYWPPIFWGASFVWFLPVLPGYCPVYWWDQVPYYYYDNAYYTWDSDDNGYVATAPPPAAADDSGAADDDSDNLYAYPENGQSPEQQAQDRQACDQWAAAQSRSDGTEGNSGATSQSGDYQRALSACLTGRGYSVD